MPSYHETIMVTAAPWAVDRADVAQSANVIDTAEVRTRAGLSLGDAIGSLLGFYNLTAVGACCDGHILVFKDCRRKKIAVVGIGC